MSGKDKLVVGRNNTDNELILQLAGSSDIIITPVKLMGPVGLLSPSADSDCLQKAASICARYCDHEGGAAVDLHVSQGVKKKIIKAVPLGVAEMGMTLI